MNLPQPSTTLSLDTSLSTFTGDIVSVQDLVVGTATGPAVGDSEAQAAAAAVGKSTCVGA